MSTFRYDDVVLLKWEITGTGRCVSGYSHFNSMMKRSIQAEQRDNDRKPVYGANNSQVKISGNAVVVLGESVGVRYETRTRGVLKLVR